MMRLDVGRTTAYTPHALYEWTDGLGGETVPPSPMLACNSGTTETRLVTSALDPEKQYEAERAAKHDASRQLNAEIERRIRELIIDALLASEPLSQDSLLDLRSFMSQISFGRRPAVYLLDNGNFRAVWRNAENEQAAFQFRGGGIVHCVFFLKRKAPQLPLSQETLIDVIPKVRARLIDFEHLLQG